MQPEFDIIVHHFNDTYCKLEVSSPSINAEIADYMKFYVDNYRFNPKFKAGIWDGFIQLYARRTGELPVGLLSMLIKFAKNNGYTIDVCPSFNKDIVSDLDEWLVNHPVYSNNTEITPYWYQKDSVKWALENRRGILNLPTSSGKSLIIAMLAKYHIANTDKKVLIIVPNVQLVTQLQKDLIDYQLFEPTDLHGIKAGVDKDSESASIYISTWQSQKDADTDYLSQFDMLLLDEAHNSASKVMTEINKKMINCPYKIGLTGTLRDCKTNLTQLISIFGDVFRPVTTKDLMDSGEVTELKPQCIILKYSDAESKSIKGLPYADEIKYITQHKKRNQFLSKLSCISPEENTIILFRHIKHGKALTELIKHRTKDSNRKVYYIAGDIKPSERSKYTTLIEKEKGAIIVASIGTMSTGISIKNLHRAIFAHPTKSKIVTLQSVGRLLRKHKSKEYAKLYDIIDDFSVKKHSNFALKHGVARIKLYAKEKFDYIIKKLKF